MSESKTFTCNQRSLTLLVSLGTLLVAVTTYAVTTNLVAISADEEIASIKNRQDKQEQRLTEGEIVQAQINTTLKQIEVSLTEIKNDIRSLR